MTGIKINFRDAILVKDKNNYFLEVKGRSTSGVNFSWQSPVVFTVDTSVSLTVSGLTITADSVLGGSLGVVIDWGDGNTETLSSGTTYSNLSHVYATPQVFDIRITGSRGFSARLISNTCSGIKGFYGSGSEFISRAESVNLTFLPTFLPLKFTSISNALRNCTSFNQDVSSWVTNNVTQMISTFLGATSFNQDISGWNTSNVTSILSIFNGATSFNQNISSWDTSNVIFMSRAFNNATSFNQDLSSWNISNVTEMEDMLSGSGLSTENYSRTLIGWANQHFAGNAKDNVSLGATGKTYNNTAYTTGNQFNDAVSARAYLVNTAGWTITDGGQV